VYSSPPVTTRIAAGARVDCPTAVPAAGEAAVLPTPQIASPIAR